jgi:hypothetical protein
MGLAEVRKLLVCRTFMGAAGFGPATARVLGVARVEFKEAASQL